ncbi:twin-arginine translocase TatA/TatE family subunit [Streptosporangium algeriense]|uniref:Sec-independent protein translocase protein TatA n=1 Tax=Streptosporangium algeriense TaxID=1682748 RepID=A0ABW3DY38_9ACTN
MAGLGTGEILIIALVLVALFGSRKLPDMARSVGRSLRVFKAETDRSRADDNGSRSVSGAALEEQARLLEEQAARLRAQTSKA